MANTDDKRAVVEAYFKDGFDELEDRLVALGPGVQEVMDTYARAQRSVDQVANFNRADHPPIVTTSNGSGLIS